MIRWAAVLFLVVAQTPPGPGSPAKLPPSKGAPQGAAKPATPKLEPFDDLPVLTCTGTEPFWAMQLSAKRIATNISERKRELAPTRPMKPSNRTEPWIFQTRAGKDRAIVVVRHRDCSDGMSDRTYPYEVLLVIGDDAVDGCCEPLADEPASKEQ